MKSAYTLLTAAQAVEIYLAGQYLRRNSIRQRGKSVGIAQKFGVSPKAIRDIWERRSWVKETRHLWAVTDMPKIRCKQSLKTRSAVSSVPLRRCQQDCREHGMPDNLPLLERGTKINSKFYFQPPLAFIPMTRVQSSFPTFAEVTYYGTYVARESIQPAKTLFAKGPPGYAQSLRLAQYAPTPPLPAAALPPPLAAWAPCDGSCGVCGAARGVARAVGSATAARDDPFHFDWPHW